MASKTSTSSSSSSRRQKVQVGWYRFVPFLGYHHVLMILIAITIILLSLLLAGCSSSSPLIPDIFLLSIYYKSYDAVPDTAQVDYNLHSAIENIAGDASLQARVGYFGICINPDGGSWLCSNNATALAKEVDVDQDPLNLIWLAAQFKDMIVFPYLIIIAIIFAFICLLLLATFPGWHEETDSEGSDREVKPFPLSPRLPDRFGSDLHFGHFRSCLCTLATHSVRGRLGYSPGFRQRSCQEWRRYQRHGFGLVLVRTPDRCYNRSSHHDPQYKRAQFDGIGNLEFTWVFADY
ncbi:hypothetical protein NXS19_010164 [Fusarium pseudograminearum]|nr:hypothetical protein NXS19_010164 [Fusarium pseudograminearum]